MEQQLEITIFFNRDNFEKTEFKLLTHIMKFNENLYLASVHLNCKEFDWLARF